MWASSGHLYLANQINDFKFKVRNSFFPVSRWPLQPTAFTAPRVKFISTSLLVFLPFLSLFCGAAVAPGYSPYLLWQSSSACGSCPGLQPHFFSGFYHTFSFLISRLLLFEKFAVNCAVAHAVLLRNSLTPSTSLFISYPSFNTQLRCFVSESLSPSTVLLPLQKQQ